MNISKIALIAGLLAVAAPAASFANSNSSTDFCSGGIANCATGENLVGKTTTSYGILDSRGSNTAIVPSFTPDGSQAIKKVIVADQTPQKAGHDTAAY
jgi:hypothetical protein